MPVHKTCIDCKQELSLEHFHKSPTEKHGVRSRCKQCRAKFNISNNCNRKWNLKKFYGITIETFDNMLKRQGFSCAICGTTNPKSNYNKFCIDHDHKTGKIRGLLCQPCNTALGLMQDNIESLQNAITYLNERK